MSIPHFIEGFRRDLTVATRTFSRDRGWFVLAVATLALGIGINSAVFSVVRALVLNPLPYPHADRVVALALGPRGSKTRVIMDPRLVNAWRGARAFEDFAPTGMLDATLSDGGDPISIRGTQVDDRFFSFAGARPVIGRPFVAADFAPNSPPVALIGEGLWRRRYGGSREIVGRTVKLDEQTFTIIGVAPAWLGQSDLWTPLFLDRVFGIFDIYARLRPGVSPQTAEAELEALRHRVDSRPDGVRPIQTRITRAADLATFKNPLLMLWGAVALLLVLTCANVAHLLLVRGASREREMAIRIALGANRGDLVRQVLTECAILAVTGCVAGLGLGQAFLRIAVALCPPTLNALSLAHVDGTVVALAVGTSLVTAAVFTLFTMANLSTNATSLSQRVAASNVRRRRTIQSGLVATEMAISTALLVGALLFVRSAINAQRVAAGFDTADLYVMSPYVSFDRVLHGLDVTSLADHVADQVRTLPGVKAVTIAEAIPPSSQPPTGDLALADSQVSAQPSGVAIRTNTVRGEYFRVLGIPIRIGRGFDGQSAGRRDAIASEAVTRRLWPGRSPLGQRLAFVNQAAVNPVVKWYTVIGVAGDVVGTADDAFRQPVIYLPRGAGGPSTTESIVVRVQHGTEIAADLRRAAARVDPLAVPSITTAEQLFINSTARQRFTIAVLTIFALFAVVLAAVGLYGVVAYVVAQRTRDIGLRIALGATNRHVCGDVLLHGLRLAVPGIIIGFVGSLLEGHLIASMLYGVTPSNVATYAMCAVLLFAIAVLACVQPMWRALRIAPLVALRAE